ncbi:DUF3015 domain-containing protein [bacterium]|nr:DUF3015 domain-containing protein [bacterium]
MKKILGIVTSCVLASASYAASYGDAGCGLGSMAFGNQDGFVQIFAATTNGLSGNQTFGITSGTSNCGGGGSSATALQYIEANKVALANDVARGQGETLSALNQIMGCDASASSSLQQNFESIFATDSAQQIESNIKAVIKTNKLSCSAV